MVVKAGRARRSPDTAPRFRQGFAGAGTFPHVPTVVVRHDQSIAESLSGTRADLSVVAADSEAAAVDALPGAEIFATNPTNWTDEYLDALPDGAWVQATSTGYAAFPTEEFDARGVTFTNATGNFGPPVADHAFALALALARGVAACRDSQRDREWNREIGTSLIDLGDRALTVVGLGDVGESVARRGLGFGMTVRGTKRDPAHYEGRLPDERVHPPEALADLLPETDVLVLTVPLTDETRRLVDAAALAALSEDALLVNVARGPIVDEEALLDALEDDDIAGAGLDVFATEPLPADSPLWERDDVVLTPHVGGRSEDFVRRFVDLFLDNYGRWSAGEEMRNRIV